MSTMEDDGRLVRGDRTRRALLQAARHAFAEHGYAGASLRDIASDAHANAALVRYHFGSKDQLWEAVIDEAMSALVQKMTDGLADADPRDVARKMVSIYLDHLAADPEFPRLVARGVLDGDPIVIDALTRHLAGPYNYIAAAGLDVESAVTLFGAAVVSFLYAPVLERISGRDPMDPGPLARRKEHLLGLAEELTRKVRRRITNQGILDDEHTPLLGRDEA